MRSTTKLAPVDPATSSAQRIADKIWDKVYHLKLREVEDLLIMNLKKQADADTR